MVFVKVRETYDLCTVKNKMTVIGIHTPKPDIIKSNFPGLLLQCKTYRPVSADVRIACASMQPLDPLGVGTEAGDVAPEDLFNPILYKACSNLGMSQLEARIATLVYNGTPTPDVSGNTADVDADTVSTIPDEFPAYYGLLSNCHEFRHANPQAGLEMTNLRPLVYELLYNFADGYGAVNNQTVGVPSADFTTSTSLNASAIRGNGKPIPWINCTSYTGSTTSVATGFDVNGSTRNNSEIDVNWINCMVGCIIIPPSRLHQLFYRMVVEWTLEFSQIRPISEIMSFGALGTYGNSVHYQNYSYTSTKEAVTGDSTTALDKDACMVSSNVDVTKVM